MFVNSLDLGAFFSNPIGYIKDAEKTRQEYLASKGISSDKFPEITQTFQDPVGVKPVIDTIGSGIKGIWTGLTNTIKNLPVLLLIVGIIVILYFLTPVLKKSNA